MSELAHKGGKMRRAALRERMAPSPDDADDEKIVENPTLYFDNYADTTVIVECIYTNYRGETAKRRLRPQYLWQGKTQWHPQQQWLLRAIDLDRNVERDFALNDLTDVRKIVG